MVSIDTSEFSFCWSISSLLVVHYIVKQFIFSFKRLDLFKTFSSIRFKCFNGLRNLLSCVVIKVNLTVLNNLSNTILDKMLLSHAALHLLHHHLIWLLSLHEWLLECLIWIHILLHRKLVLWWEEIWILMHVWRHRINKNTRILLLVSIILLSHRLTNHHVLELASELIHWIFVHHVGCWLILVLLRRSFSKIIFSMGKWAFISKFALTV